MFSQPDHLSDGHNLSAEVCVLGAGAAGITVALALQDSGISCVVVESGEFKFDEKVEALDRGVAVGIPYDLDGQRRRGFGGSTNCWAGWCVPMSDEDFLSRNWMEGTGWPIGAHDVLPYYPAAARVIDIAGHQFDVHRWMPGLGMARGDLPALSPFEPSMWQLSPPTRMGEKFRAAFESSTRIHCALGFTAIRLNLDREGNRIQSARCQSLDGRSIEVSAHIFVLALGGIENARLMLLSSNRRSAGIGNEFDQVGRNFLEHPAAIEGADLYVYRDGPGYSYFARSGKGLAPKSVPPFPIESYHLSASLRNAQETNTANVVLGISLGADAQRRLRLPQFWVVPKESTFPDERREGEARAVMSALPDGRKRPFVRIGLTFAVEQAPNPESRIRLGDGRDPLGQPQAVLDWKIFDKERKALSTCLALLGKMAVSADIGRIRLNLDPESASSWVPIGGAHLMGTTRMGSVPKTSVVDRNCRVHSVPNLFVAGSSVFPTSTFGNPTYTVVALALRLAQHLKGLLTKGA